MRKKKIFGKTKKHFLAPLLLFRCTKIKVKVTKLFSCFVAWRGRKGTPGSPAVIVAVIMTLQGRLR